MLMSRSASAAHHVERAKKLEEDYEILRRKYHRLDVFYQEAKVQNELLRKELAQKREQWKKWIGWWMQQRPTLAHQTASKVRTIDVPRMDIREAVEGNQSVVEADQIVDEEEMSEPPFHRTVRHDEIALSGHSPSISPRHKSEDIGSLMWGKRDRKADELEEISTELPSLKRPSVTPNDVEIIDVPKSPAVNKREISLPKETTARSTTEQSPHPKSAPAKLSRPAKTTDSHMRAGVRKRKKKEYPSMKYFTEDGTDGINRLPDSPEPPEQDTGILKRLLGSLSPSPPRSVPISNQAGAALTPLAPRDNEIPAKQEVIGTLSEPEGEEIRESKKAKTCSSRSERRRPLLSPDLAVKNKGRGRYSTSVLVR